MLSIKRSSLGIPRTKIVPLIWLMFNERPSVQPSIPRKRSSEVVSPGKVTSARLALPEELALPAPSLCFFGIWQPNTVRKVSSTSPQTSALEDEVKPVA